MRKPQLHVHMILYSYNATCHSTKKANPSLPQILTKPKTQYWQLDLCSVLKDKNAFHYVLALLSGGIPFYVRRKLTPDAALR